MPKTNLGRFLYSERIRRGNKLISEYLKNYANIPISEPYYRDIENGRKIINIVKAETLCKALKLNKQQFYYHLLSDILPSDILKNLLKPITTNVFKSPFEEFNKLDQKISTLRKAYEKRLIEEPYIVDNEIVRYLDKNFELLPLIHFIYLKRTCSFEELQKIINKNNIKKKSFNQIIDEFEKYNIAIIDRKKKTVTRYRKIFRIPRNDIGIKFKDKFLKNEIEESIKTSNREQIIGPNNSFIFSGIFCIKKKSLQRISNKLTDLLAELEIEESTLDEAEVTPYFISIIFSSREKYSAKENEK